MTPALPKPFSALLVCLLVLIGFSAPGLSTASAPSPTQSVQEAMPGELLTAFLAASSQPFETSPEGYRARSAGLDLTLSRAGLRASGPGLAWSLVLSGLGRGERIAATPEAVIVPVGNRLEYRRGVVTEWYQDTALGVEQGFVIHRAPRGAGKLALRLDLSTNLAGKADAGGRGLSFVGPSGQMLHYDHLQAWDANGAPLDATLRLAAGQVTIQVADLGAAYPITIDPLIAYEERIVVSYGALYDYFGYSAALSSDGDRALVGAPYHDVDANLDQGAVYVFARSGSAWVLEQQLVAPDGAAGDMFGYSVAVSGDTALIGALHDMAGTYADGGSAYVFTRSDTGWTQQAQLLASGGAAGDEFGSSVALSGDTALVGAWLDDVGGFTDRGSAYVFVRSGMTWAQQAQLAAVDGASDDRFGCAVALSADGSTALAGAYLDRVGNTLQGSAYVFTRSGADWTQQAQLTASDGTAGDDFGYSVALAADGNTALVGASRDQVGANAYQGSAYVFARGGNVWDEQAHLTASDGAAGDRFGYSVGLSGDTALVGAPWDDAGAGNAQGSAYAFVRSGEMWTQQDHLTASDGTGGDGFGYSLALSGATALVGAPTNDVYWTDEGSAYVYTQMGMTWNEQARLIASDGADGDEFGTSVALSGDTALVGAPLADVGSSNDQGSVYVFAFGGSHWSLQQKLTALDGAAYDHFGACVALSGNTALVGAPYRDVSGNASQGSAYVFTRSGTVWTQQEQLTAADGEANDNFGWSVALSGGGTRAVVGAYKDDLSFKLDQGSVYVFGYSLGGWVQDDKLTAADGLGGDRFGVSVALSGDGNTALVGAYLDDVGANATQGSAYVFVHDVTWSQQAHLKAADGAAADEFGISVALAGDTALVGAWLDDVGPNIDQGSAYVVVRSGDNWMEQAHLTAADGEAGDSFGVSVALSGDGKRALVGAHLDDVAGRPDTGSAYIFDQRMWSWSEQVRLSSWWTTLYAAYGSAVALSADGKMALVGAPLDDIDISFDQGVAYAYWLKSAVYLPLVLRNAP